MEDGNFTFVMDIGHEDMFVAVWEDIYGLVWQWSWSGIF